MRVFSLVTSPSNRRVGCALGLEETAAKSTFSVSDPDESRFLRAAFGSYRHCTPAEKLRPLLPWTRVARHVETSRRSESAKFSFAASVS